MGISTPAINPEYAEYSQNPHISRKVPLVPLCRGTQVVVRNGSRVSSSGHPKAETLNPVKVVFNLSFRGHIHRW